MANRIRSWSIWVAVAIAVNAGAATAARADWIVTRDGGRFEIKGAWQVKGKLVVFHLPDGTLGSVRADKVDLAASKLATEQAEQAKREAKEAAAAPPPEQVKPRKKSVLVLTDKDFKKPASAAGGDSGGAGDGGKAKDPARDPDRKEVPVAAGTLAVLGWDRAAAEAETRAGGVQITGRVRNTSTDYLTDISVAVHLFNEAGTEVAKAPAELAASSLPPGEATTFSATARGIFSFAALRFETAGRGFRPKTKAEASSTTTVTPAVPPGT
ncbi:MAG TPA: FxLYD domain-containing protein [Thermoanaerobaculia bacterium]|nr:FxLYD domain-containing protein [Thermoanaerobaculia bacterium]